MLGLISLQSLPRRLTLDFRDIFSDGLAFDSIEGKLAIRKGHAHDRPLRIDGPAAQIEMQGETDLKNETQDLQVVVRLGGAAAAVGVDRQSRWSARLPCSPTRCCRNRSTAVQLPLSCDRYVGRPEDRQGRRSAAGSKPSVEEDNKP